MKHFFFASISFEKIIKGGPEEEIRLGKKQTSDEIRLYERESR